MGYVKLSGTTNRHENWATEFVVEVDEETGEPTKVAKLGVPVDLSKAEQEKLEGLGAIFEDSSADEAKEVQAQLETEQPVGGDITGSAPVFGNAGDAANQNVEPPKGDDGKTKSTKNS